MTEIKPIRKPRVVMEEVLPRIVIDTREQTPLVFTLPSEVRGLESGDYSLAGSEHEIAIERKSLADAVACTMGENRERYFRELRRLKGYRFSRILVIGNPLDIEQRRTYSNLHPNAFFGTLSTIEVRFNIPVVWAATPEIAAKMVQRWVYYFARERIKELQAFAENMVSAPSPG